MITLAERRQEAYDAPPRPQIFDVDQAYAAHGREIHLFCLNALRDPGSAEECVQETFVRAWRARERFDPELGSMRTWLFAIARNIIRDAHRRGSRVPEPVDDSRMRRVSDGTPDPAQNLMLVEALATLSAEHRQVIVAIHMTGLSYAELSAATDVPVPTLRSRTYYGLRALRRHFDGEEATDE